MKEEREREKEREISVYMLLSYGKKSNYISKKNGLCFNYCAREHGIYNLYISGPRRVDGAVASRRTRVRNPDPILSLTDNRSGFGRQSVTKAVGRENYGGCQGKPRRLLGGARRFLGGTFSLAERERRY